MKTFEDYLKDVHYKEYPMVLDDDLPDHFDNWMGEQEVEDIIKYANAYGEEGYAKDIEKNLLQSLIERERGEIKRGWFLFNVSKIDDYTRAKQETIDYLEGLKE